MRVHNISLQIRQTHRLHDGFAEKNKTLSIVLEIAFAVAVRRATIVKFVTTNQIHREIFSWRKRPRLAGHELVTHLDFEPQFQFGPTCIPMFTRDAITRQEYGYLMALIG